MPKPASSPPTILLWAIERRTEETPHLDMSSVSKVGGDSVNNQLQRIISLVFLLSKPWVIDDGAPVLTWVGKIVLEKGMVLVRREAA